METILIVVILNDQARNANRIPQIMNAYPLFWGYDSPKGANSIVFFNKMGTLALFIIGFHREKRLVLWSVGKKY